MFDKGRYFTISSFSISLSLRFHHASDAYGRRWHFFHLAEREGSLLISEVHSNGLTKEGSPGIEREQPTIAEASSLFLNTFVM